MSMQIDGERNFGYPYDSGSAIIPDWIAAPYPEMMWRTDGEYPEICSVPDMPVLMNDPYPDMAWGIDHYNNDGYPCINKLRVQIPIVKAPKIYDRIRVYDKMCTDFSNNGMAILSPESCEISEELNGGYELALTHPQDPDGAWKNLVEFRLIKARGQVFRIYAKETSTTSRSVSARHLFYDLNSYLIKSAHPTNLSGQAALDWILSHTYNGTPPFVVHSDITDMHTAYYEHMSPTCAMIGAENSFINVWGGELYRDNYDIYINQHRGHQNAFRLRYGCNLTDITETVDCSDYCPRIYWEAKVCGVDNAKRGTSSFRQIGLPIQPMRYLSITVDEQITEIHAVNNDIDRQVKEYVSGHCMPLVNYSISIADILNMPEYADFIGLSEYNIGDTGTIYSESLGISTTQQIIKKTIDGITGEVLSIELGNAKKSIVAHSGHIVGTYQFEDAQREAAAENTWDKLGAARYTWNFLKNLSWEELSGKVAINYE